ncbi:larval/pupal cuticle protein H1C-like [Chironomus tepperi]|uniref:larval/pupal cuticle protein H1C-like n=1 Tax=Chironomus tepperi TaxID=113505 RepID=UPI00391F8E2F
MFKLVVLSCLVAVACAGYVPASVAYEKTIVEPHVSVVETPTVSHVGTAYKNVPTGVSHHSSSVVHGHASVVEPIYAHGVEKKYISTPVVKKVVEHVPAVVPVAKVVAAEPYYAKSYVSEPAYYAKQVVAAPAYTYAHAAPLAYTAPVYAPKAYGYAAYPSAYSYGHHW